MPVCDRFVLRIARQFQNCSLLHNQGFYTLRYAASCYSSAGNPYDNSVCEAFFKTLKEEELYRREYHSEAEMKKSVSDYIERYNTKRPHTYLRYKTPEWVEAEYFAQHTLT